MAHTDLIPVIDGGIAIDTFENGTLRNATWRSHVVRPERSCMSCNGQLDLGQVVPEMQGLLDDPSYITGADRRGLTLGENVAPLSASVSASLLAQYVSLGVAPGGLGDPGPLQYLLSSHHLAKLADVTRMDCPVEAAEGAGDHRTDLNGRHQRAEHLRRLVASPGGRLRMLRWIDDRAQAVIDWLDRHSRTP